MMQRLRNLFAGQSSDPEFDSVKEKLTVRQEGIADRLAKMQGKTRDEVLAEAYRRADRVVKRR